MSFQRNINNDVWIWRGNPNCDAAQTSVRTWLRGNVKPYPSTWIPGDTRLQGNLGESITFCCGFQFWGADPHCVAANAWTPFAGISRNEIDLLWIYFGAHADDDVVIHQEVKTTIAMDLAYARTVLDDYRKSFGIDPRQLLNTHLQAAKSRLKYTAGRPDLAKRVTALQSDTAQAADRLLVIPTLVHDTASEDPVPRMAGIDAELRADGFQDVQCWAIGLSDLADRLRRITEDLP